MISNSQPESKTDSLLPAGPSADLSRVLADLSAEQGEGELVIRSPDGVGRVHLVAGRVAWVQVVDARPTFTRKLVDGGFVSREDIKHVVDECRRTGANFCNTLLEWGLIDPEALRALLRDDIGQGLSNIASWRAPQALFLPQSTRFQSDLTFSTAELWPSSTPNNTPTPETGDEKSSSAVALTENAMKNVTDALAEAMEIDGAIAAALVDYESGMSLGTAGGNDNFNVELAAAGNTDVVRAKMRVARELGLPGSIEDILITLTTQHHLIRPLSSQPGLFFYVALDRSRTNLAMARFRLTQIESRVTV